MSQFVFKTRLVPDPFGPRPVLSKTKPDHKPQDQIPDHIPDSARRRPRSRPDQARPRDQNLRSQDKGGDLESDASRPV